MKAGDVVKGKDLFHSKSVFYLLLEPETACFEGARVGPHRAWRCYVLESDHSSLPEGCFCVASEDFLLAGELLT